MRVFFSITLCCLLLCCDRVSTTPNKAEGKDLLSTEQPSGLDTLSPNIQDTVLARQLLEASVEAFNSQKFQKSYELADSARVLYENVLGDHKQTAQAINQMGRSRYSLSDIEEAVSLFEQVEELTARKPGIETADAYYYLGKAYGDINKFEKALSYHEKALSLRMKLLGETDTLIAASYNSIGITHEKNGNYLKALEYYREAKATQENNINTDPARLALYTGNIGNVWQYLGDHDHALNYQLEALRLWDKSKSKSKIPKQAMNLSNIGVTYYEMGDYLQAKDYYLKALNLCRSTIQCNTKYFFSFYNNLANVYNELGEHASAQKYLEQALDSLSSPNLKNEYYFAIVYNNLGITSSKREQYRLAITFYEKAQRISERQGDTSSIAFYALNQAANYAMLNDFKRAHSILEQALLLWEEKLGSYHPYVAIAHINIGRIHERKGNYAEAIKWFSRGLNACQYEGEGFETVNSIRYVMEAFFEMSKAYKSSFEDSGVLESLKEANNYANLSLSALEYQRNQFQRQGSALLWRDQNYAFFENAIDIQLRLAAALDDDKHIWKALLIADKAKTYALREHLRDMNALNVAGIPDSLIAKEQELRTAITWREKQYQGAIAAGAQQTDSFPLALSAQLADLRLAHKSLKDQFERNYPDYYQLKYKEATIDPNQLQQLLAQDERSLLEYFVRDSSIYCFAVTPVGIEAHKVQREITLDTLVRQMRGGIAGMVDKAGNAANAAQRYAVAANELYEAVFSPLSDVLSASRRLVIVPDGALAYVPFDALVRSLPEDVSRLPEFDYLLKEHMISYSYSAALFLEMSSNTQRKKAKKKWLGVAPIFTGQAVQDAPRFGFSPLPLNQAEVDSIQRLIGGSVLEGAAATEEAFLSAAPDYQILHLATHGYGDRLTGDNSYLAFTEAPNGKEDEILFARELYNQQFNADLVVLSACETSMGQLQRGEGIISLARGFSFAGAKSMVTSLWTVSERPTVALLQQFYKRLVKDGHSKDEALWKAKLKLLSGEFQEPYYWAAFVPVGDMEAIVVPKNGSALPWWVLITAIVAVLFLFGLWRRNKGG